MNKRYTSLNELLEEFKICIPIIQRDYIQGGNYENINNIRKRMLDDIFDCLEGKINSIDLGIIYGINNENVFYPVDGQQRLTTLYLIYMFLGIKAGEENLEYKIRYETRKSAKEFFAILTHKNDKLYYEIKNIILKENKISYIKNKPWFKIQYNNDTTITSALNLIEELIKMNITKEKAKEYFDNISKIKFHFLKDDTDSAEESAAVQYIRMNSRGKQLTKFENVKVVLETLEEKINLNFNEKNIKFSYYYDNKYIDIFYKRAQKYENLLDKMHYMNENSINFIMSVYNILIIVFNNCEYKQFDKFTDYYNCIYEASKDGREMSQSEENFWREYFYMLNGILDYMYSNEEELHYIEGILDDIYFFKNASSNKDSNKIIVFTRYLYHMFKNSNKSEKMLLNKLNYCLDSLYYNNWIQNAFIEAENVAKNVSQCNNSIDYFYEMYSKVMEMYDTHQENANIISMNIDFDKIKISDIRQRFKEVAIKVKIIKDYNYDYKQFERMEERSQCNKIQYLLYISDMWDGAIDTKKVDLLKRYIIIADKYFMKCNEYYYSDIDLEWRKIFAVACNWDEEKNKLLSNDKIKRMCGERKNNYNVWYWNDNYYFWNDDEKISKTSLNIVKKAYDLIIQYDLLKTDGTSFYKTIFSEEQYDSCYLKYAVDRKYKRLFINIVQEKEGEIIIQDQGEKNIFAYIYYLDIPNITKLNVGKDCSISESAVELDNFYLIESIDQYFTLNKGTQYLHKVKNKIYYEPNFDHNMYLYAEIKVKLEDELNSQLFLYNSENNSMYKYVFAGNKYDVYCCSIEEIKNKLLQFRKEVREDLESIDLDRLLDINWNYDKKWIRFSDRRYKEWDYYRNNRFIENVEWRFIGSRKLSLNILN